MATARRTSAGAAFTLDGVSAVPGTGSEAGSYVFSNVAYKSGALTLLETAAPQNYDGVTAPISLRFTTDSAGTVTGLAPAEGAALPEGVSINGFVVTVRNTRQTGSLTIEKTLLGGDEQTFDFTVTPDKLHGQDLCAGR